ncbi:HlyD family secretion protein [Persicirhabdus sediminis]|uniref:HlyD family secretion protein n=1 Tax=Persicirhabdus sediminis TaxID=454144 RepID=A0A8J7MDT0_9BACT|nr:HlyD family secretion protein [Persicirhabdus sediminis]MBK1790807.1 HlyD family secretion protein [Persicirhabdus sediminis]
MSEEASDSKAAEPAAEKPKRDPIKFWTKITVVLVIVMFFAHILSDKYVPYTSNARVDAYIVPLSAQVSGNISKVYVNNNQLVKAGDKLIEIDAEKYQLAVEQAQADLQQASQTSSADVSSVTTAQAKVTEAEANLTNAKVKGERIIRLSEQGAASMSRADDARSRIASSEAQLLSAKSELEKAKSNLGQTGQDNARIKSALANLEKAQLDLQRATIVAPADGVITNFSVDVGHFANTGAPIMTFISVRDVWIQANMRENSLSRIKPGNSVEIVLDAAPGKVFTGHVRSVSFGVDDNTGNQLGGLTTVKTTQGWLREAQQFPVIIDFTDANAKGFKRVNGQSNVIVYTGDGVVFNSLGKAWIRIVSFFSHIY